MVVYKIFVTFSGEGAQRIHVSRVIDSNCSIGFAWGNDVIFKFWCSRYSRGHNRHKNYS